MHGGSRSKAARLHLTGSGTMGSKVVAAPRNIVRLALFVAFVAGAGLGATRGPVCRWGFDEALTDQAGRCSDALSALDALGRPARVRFLGPEELPGAVGKAVALGVQLGDAARLVAPLSADTRLGASYTIEAWVHPTQVGGWNRLVLNWGAAPRYAYHLALHNGLASLYHGQADGTYRFAEGGRLVAGRWYHIAGVARRNDADPARSTLEVYLNGKLVAKSFYDGTVRELKSEGLGIGDSAGAPSQSCRFQGYLDELAIWDRALPLEEIAAHYAARSDILAKLPTPQEKEETAPVVAVARRLADLGVSEIVFAERQPGRDPSGHYYANFGYSCIDPNYWIHGADGGRLCKLDLRTGLVTALVDDPGGAVRDPRVHYNGKKILFSYRRAGTHHYTSTKSGLMEKGFANSPTAPGTMWSQSICPTATSSSVPPGANATSAAGWRPAQSCIAAGRTAATSGPSPRGASPRTPRPSCPMGGCSTHAGNMSTAIR